MFIIACVKLIGIWCSKTLSDQIELQAELWRRAQDSHLAAPLVDLSSRPGASSSAASSSGQQRGGRSNNKNKNKNKKSRSADNARSRARAGRSQQLRADEMDLAVRMDTSGAGPSSVRSWQADYLRIHSYYWFLHAFSYFLPLMLY